MATNWVETIGGLNSFADNLKKEAPDTKITVTAFDSAGFDVVRDGKKAKKFVHITEDEVSPRGMTPLFDAISSLAGMVDKAKPKRASILILTDGAENHSRETTREGAAKIVEKWKKAGFDVVYIGADFDAFGEAGGLGIGRDQTLNASKHALSGAFAVHSARAVAYSISGDNTVPWSAEDREIAKG